MRGLYALFAVLALLAALSAPAGGNPEELLLGRLVPRDWRNAEPLPVRGLSLRIHLAEHLARVEVDQVFYNPHGQLEGEYTLSIPPGARVTRLSMNVPDRMMEGEIADRQHGRKVYETIVRKKRDPALTECMGGTLFRTRVFPVFRQSDKRILLEYTLPLPPGCTTLEIPWPHGERGPRLPWFELKIDGLKGTTKPVVSFMEGGRKAGEVTLDNEPFLRRDFKASGSLQVRWEGQKVKAKWVAGPKLADGTYPFLAVLPLVPPALSADPPRDFILLADTSAGGGKSRLEATARAVETLLQSLRPLDRFALFAFDLTPAPFDGGTLRIRKEGAIRAAGRWLRERGAAGATHLGRALQAAVKNAGKSGGERPVEIVLVSDGFNAMDGDPKLAEFLSSLPDSPNLRIHALGVGNPQDTDLLRKIAQEGRGKFIPMGRNHGKNLREAFILPEPQFTVVSQEAELSVVASRRGRGGGVLLAGFGKEPLQEWISIKGGFGSASKIFCLQQDEEEKDVAFLCAFARIAGRESGGNSSSLVALSRQYGILCRATAYIVLETEADYDRWGIPRVQAGRRDPLPAVPHLPLRGKTLPFLVAPRASEGLKATPLAEDFYWGLGGISAEPKVARAIEAALAWLQRHQNPDGSWSCRDFSHLCTQAPCWGKGMKEYGPGVSGLALMAFLCAGEERCRNASLPILRGIDYLIRIQDAEGCIGPRNASGHWIYGHAVCTQALARAARVFPRPKIQKALERASAFLIDCQNPYLGWRYGKRTGENDTSVTGWCAEALFEARISGVTVDASVFKGALNWLDKITD
ncbi:MAG: VIT domain-containing protein, partial [Planctomycetota bacterium]